MGWLLAFLLLAGGDRHTVYWHRRRVSTRGPEQRDRAGAIPALAIPFLAVTWAVVAFSPAWLWGLTWQGAALWFGLAHWYQVTVAGYFMLAILAVLALARAMFAILERCNTADHIRALK